jgi:hypothetical protein
VSATPMVDIWNPERLKVELGHDRLDRRPVGEHGHEHLGAVDRLRRALGHPRAEPFGLLPRAVPDRDLVAGAGEVPGDRPAMIPVPRKAMRMGGSYRV